MTRKQKEKELLKMPDTDLIDRILAFPDRQHLNRDEEGKRRRYPSAEMAVNARRNMEKNPEWKISDKQRWAMAHSFAEYSSDELKVAGIKFAKADPNELVKNPLSKEGVKTVYAMQFTLIPEPENEHDKNAVAVYVRNEKDEGEVTFKDVTYQGLTKIGYVPAAYADIHPITDIMTAKGILTDHSNGHFKTISYTMDMDTEKIDRDFAPSRRTDAYTYQMPFILNGPAKDGAASYINNKNDWTERINNELEYHGVNGHADNVYFQFPGGKTGNIVVETPAKFNSEAMGICGSYFRYCLESNISNDLARERLVDVPKNLPAVNTRERTYFSLQFEPDDGFAAAVGSLADGGQSL